MKVIQIETSGKPIEAIAGLAWHPLLPDNFKKEMRPLAKEMDKDLYVYWKSAHSIIGFASVAEGASPGQFPIALIIAKALEAETAPMSSLVAVAAPDDSGLYFYVSRRNGHILADGDAVGTEDEIKSRMFEDFGFGGWDLLVCPSHWRINGSEPRTFDSFLPKRNEKTHFPNAWKLKPVKVTLAKTAMRVMALTVVPMVLTYGYLTWQKSEVQKRIAVQAAAVAAQEEEQRKQNLQKEPWPELPTATAFASSCESALNRTGLIATNWSFAGFTCEGNQYSVRWERTNLDGLVSQLKTVMSGVHLDASGAFATQTELLSISSPVSADPKEIAPDLNLRIERLSDLYGVYGIGVSMKVAATTQSSPPTTPSTPQWVELGVVATSSLGIGSTAKLLSAPAFRLTKISGHMKNGLLKYQFTGIQYAKP